MRRMRSRTLLPLLLAAVLAACVGGAATPSGAGSAIVAEVATYQVVAGQPARLLVALQSADNLWLSFGSVRLSFRYAGDGSDATPPPGAVMADVTADFLPIPDSPPDTGGPPELTFPADGHGLYAADGVTFPTVGFWQVIATGTMDDGTEFTADAAVQTLDAPTVPVVGDPALATDNAVIGDDVPNSALDSRASGDAPVPDPELHRVSIADALTAGRPALVVFSTPVYCVSRFCGPVTDMVEGLAADYADRADFIHVEIYRDFQAQELNPAVEDWLVGPDGDYREPWVYLIGADGSIIGSWDTVATRDEIEPLLRALPPS